MPFRSGRAGASALAAALLLASPAPAREACQGRDLLPRLEAEAPAAYAAIQAAARAMPFGRGRLFRVTREGREPSHLLATLHVSDPRATVLSDAVRSALAAAAVVALEIDEPEAKPRRLAARKPAPAVAQAVVVAPDGRRPPDLLDEEALAALRKAVVSRGLPSAAADRFKPAVLALILDTPACAVPRPGEPPVLDRLVAKTARKAGARIVGLETLAGQVDALGGLPPGAERALLAASTRLAPHAEDMHETALARYEARDLAGLLAWMASPVLVPGLEAFPIPPAFVEALIEGRNRGMLDRARPLLEAGRAIIAVGAAHLPGENGLARLLEREGYRIELVE